METTFWCCDCEGGTIQTSLKKCHAMKQLSHNNCVITMLLQSIQWIIMHNCVAVALLSSQTMSTVRFPTMSTAFFLTVVLNSASENIFVLQYG